MKKIICTVLALTLVFALSVCLAEDAASKMPDLSGIELPDYKSYMDPVEKSSGSGKGTFTADSVYINGSQYQIVTPAGVSLSYTAMSDEVCFTQDIVQQMSLFSAVYQSPLEVVSSWMDREMHLNIYKPSTNVDIYIHVFPSSMSSIFTDSNALNDEEAAYLYDFMVSDDGPLHGSTDGTVGWLGGNVWFLGDMRQEDGTVTLIAFVGGQEIFCYAGISSEEQYADMIDMLDNLTITMR